MRKQAVYLGAVGAQAVASAALIPLLTRALSQADYGQVAFVAVGQQLIATAGALGLPGLVTSWESGRDDEGLRQGAALPVIATGVLLVGTATLLHATVLLFVFLLGSLNAVASLFLARMAARGRAGLWAMFTIGIGPVSILFAAVAAASTGSFIWYLATWAAGIALFVAAGLRWADPQWFRRTSVRSCTRLLRLSLPLAISMAAAVALASGDRVVVGTVLGDEVLARYQAAYAVGNLAAMAGTALSNHWLPGLMRGEARARRNHLLSIGTLALLGALVAGPALAVLLPADYASWRLWPVAALAALTAIPQALYLQFQARATHLGDTRTVGTGALVVTTVSMALTYVIARTTAVLPLVALVTPLSYLALTAHLRRRQAASRPDVLPGPRAVIVLLSSVRWGYLWQRHQSLALAATARGTVVFVESQPRRLRQLLTAPTRLLAGRRQAVSFTPIPEGLQLVAPSAFAVLAPRIWAQRQSRLILEEAQGGPVSVLLYAPTAAYMAVARRLAAQGARITYDAVIDWALAPAHFHPPRGAVATETALPDEWSVVSDNPALARELEGRLGRSVAVVPPAADEAFLRQSWRPLDEREPIIGWFGAIHPEMDVDLLCRLSRAGFQVETVGPTEDAAVAAELIAAGVVMRPAERIDLLPARIQHWRVALLAYRGPRAETITPAKLLNALVGFRVAVRGIAVPEQLAGSVFVLSNDDRQAVEQVRQLVEGPGERALLSADQLSWHARLADIAGALT
jgi:O-antigen/teichoic acid export membrane protein